MKLKTIPLVTALLPAIAAHLCYVMAAHHGHVSWCFPYFPDCVSISAAGRRAPESVVFRAAMMPAAVLMMIYWRLSSDWLKALGTPMIRLNRAMVWLGVTAALGLFIYAGVLGEVGDLYSQPRRAGVILFYVFTYLAQLLMTVQIAPLAGTRGRPGATVPTPRYRSLVAVLGAVRSSLTTGGAGYPAEE